MENNERVGFWSVLWEIIVVSLIVAAMVFFINIIYAALVWAWAHAHVLIGRAIWRAKRAVRNWARN